MRHEISQDELAARLILGDLKASRITTHAIEISGGCVAQLSHFGSVKIEVENRAYHKRRLMVFVLEPSEESDELQQPSERELLGDALVVLESRVRDLFR